MKHCLSFSYFTFFHTESQYSVNDYQVCFTTSPDNAFTHLVLYQVLFLFPQKEVSATNRKIFITTMSVKPDSIKHKYLFLVDDYQIACSMIALGFHAFFLSSDESDFYFTACSLTDYLDEISFTGKYNADYTYVPAASSKKDNTYLENYFKKNALSCRMGWQLFKDREYLGKQENHALLEQTLNHFIDRFEGSGSSHNTTNLDRFHRFNDSGKRIGVLDMEIVEYIQKTISYFIIDGTPFVYENGVYHEDRGGIRLKYHIQSLIYKECIRSTTIQNVYNLLISQPHGQRRFHELNNQPAHWVNFKNGYFDVLEWKLIPHSPEYRMINQIPFTLNMDFLKHPPETAGIQIRKYLDFSIPDRIDQQMFWQYLGYCMTTDTCFQKFLMIKGAGGTGKSVAIALIQHIIGYDNYSSISLQDLCKRFYATGLFGKILNACADIPSTALQNVDIIKKAVGEDTLLYERKGQDPRQFRSYAKLLFSANEMPLNLDEKSNAYYRRLLILEMNQTISESSKDNRLKEKILSESDYAIFMALKHLKQLYEQNHFTESTNSKNSVEELHRSADSVKAFIDERLEYKKDSRISRTDLYQAYSDFCEENDRKALGKTGFYKQMNDKGYHDKRSSSDRFFLHLAFQNDGFLPLSENEKLPFN